jgi:RHH-type proline utilization regulon transcriptional repressor/proline dehydrogenase/delta 1-pyrroline-5-carboxylate dehydrogenase
MGIERNLLRHWPVSTHVRLAEGGSLAGLVRVLSAGMLAGASITVSAGQVLPPEFAGFLAEQDIAVSLERDEAWLERIAVAGSGESPIEGVLAERVRLIGGDSVRAAEWLGGRDRVPLWAEPVTMAGPVELLAFLREQSISIVAHRHGLAASLAGVEEWAAELDAHVRPA